MYSRFSGKNEQVSQVPEHYGGYAFAPTSPIKADPVKPPATHYFEVAAPSPKPPPTHSEITPPKELGEERPHESATLSPTMQENAPVHKPTPPRLFGNLGSAFPFSHGLGFEELLILGIILLLSQNEGESDAVLLLGLLLFCG